MSSLDCLAQVEALPRGASVEVQPVAADPATSTAADDTSDSDDDANPSPTAASSSSGPSPAGPRMEGWIGRLQNSSEKRTVQVGCGMLEVLTEALLSRGKLCRCHVSLAWAKDTCTTGLGGQSTAGEQLQSARPFPAESHAAPSQKGSLCAESLADAARSVIDSVLGALQWADVSVADVSSLKVYWRNQTPEAAELALALQGASSKCAFCGSGALLVPVAAVGSDAALTSLVHMEILAVARDR